MSVNCTGCHQPQDECGEYSYPGCVVRGRQAETTQLREKLAAANAEIARRDRRLSAAAEIIECKDRQLAEAKALLDRALNILQNIANTGFHGNRPNESVMTFKALQAIQAARKGTK